MTQPTSFFRKLKAFLFYIIPHHAISRIIFGLTRIESSVAQPAIRWFIKRYKVDMQEAANPDPRHYVSFNAFFTRALRADVRQFPTEQNIICSPVDGAISQIGHIQKGQIFQAKGHSFSTLELLGGNTQLANTFRNGSFATLYLSPRDYHRIHMPLAGSLQEMIYVPGRLFSVSPATVEVIPRLFARNERAVCIFEGDIGLFAVILVGAINVAAIETVWHGLVTPPNKRSIERYTYNNQPIHLSRGQEMGRFNMGSTVILLTAQKTDWLGGHQAAGAIKLGQPLAGF